MNKYLEGVGGLVDIHYLVRGPEARFSLLLSQILLKVLRPMLGRISILSEAVHKHYNYVQCHENSFRPPA